MSTTLEALQLTRTLLLRAVVDVETQITEIGAESAPGYDWDNAPVICELDGYRYLLGPESENKLVWKDAKAWCESVGGELPGREILLLAYLNEPAKGLFKEEWYWSSTEFSSNGAWGQLFSHGYEDNYNKLNNNSVRAVRKVLI